MKAFFLLLLCCSHLSVFSQNNGVDTSSLDYLANKYIRETIEKKPPVIKVSLYKNGKKVKKRYTVFLLVNDTIVKENKSKFKLPIKEKKSFDSISFVLNYLHTSMAAAKFDIRNFNHGGEITFGVVTDFTKEMNKYLSDSSEYLQNTGDKHLSGLLHRITKDKRDYYLNKGYLLKYFF